jgi:outer membrane protein assembly factor BamB
LALVCAGLPRTVVADDWGSLGLTAGRGRVSAELTGARFDASVWRHEWKGEPQPARRALVASPAVADGFVAFASQRNTVRVLAEDDGHLLWEARRGGAVVATPVVWRGLVFVVGVNRRLVALRLADGALVWEKDLGALAYASPVVVGDGLFVATASPAPRVHRLDPATGKGVWQAGAGTLEASALGSVAVAGDQVLVGELGGRYHSFALADGVHRWTVETGGRGGLSSPLVVKDRVYLLPGGTAAQLHAVSLGTGQALPGFPVTLPVPAADPDRGPAAARTYLTSSPAGDEAGIAFVVRADDRYGAAATGEATAVICQEQLYLVDTAGKVSWSVPNGRFRATDPNEVPTHELVPTPALYHSLTGELLIATTSSIEARLRVRAGNGDERWSASLTAPTRGSPVLANGRLVVATDAGVVESLLSGTNQPPMAPTGLAPSARSQAVATVLRWQAARDPDEEPVVHTVRLDDDGEVLRDWDYEVVLPTGLLEVSLPPLVAGSHYAFAVRGRDARGAYSPWSALQVFEATASAEVSVNERPSPSLEAALASAASGAVIRLGVGRFDLTSTARLPAGVVLAGAGAHLTTLRADGLAVGVAPGRDSELRGLTVTGAEVGVAVDEIGARLRNVILRDNADAGLAVAATGSAELLSGTLVRNGVAVRAAGATVVRNALVVSNIVGLASTKSGALTSSYNDVHLNQRDYEGLGASATDLAAAVSFPSTDDLRLQSAQATTDRGDPSDDFAREPAPNGGRINLGAFGNTEFAELSPTTGTGTGSAGSDEPPTTGAGGATTPVAQGRRRGGCSYGGPAPGLPWWLSAILLAWRGRWSRRC